MMPRRELLLAYALLVLAGCSSGQLQKDRQISANSSSGVIVLGMDVQSDFRAPLFEFLKFDPRTGKVDPEGVKRVTPSTENLTGAQKFGAAMTGQSSRPTGHQYFVFELPAGEWFLYSISGYYSDGLSASYSATSYLSKGTVVFQSRAGTASYLGEYRVTGKFGAAMDLQTLDGNLDAAQTELKKYTNIVLPLEASKSTLATFSCEMKKLFMSSEEVCQWKTVVVAVSQAK